MFSSIRAKLIAFSLLLLLAVSIATLGSVIYFFTDYTDVSAKDQARAGVRGLQNLLETAKQDMKERAVLLAANPDVIRAVEARDTAQVLAVMGKILKDAPIDSVMIVDGNGKVIARVHEPTKHGDSVAKQNGVSEALKGKITAAIEPGTTVKLSAKAGAPVRNAQGQVIGVISPGVTLTRDETVDLAKKMFQVDTTIFLGDVRESTTISKDGKRQIGTKLDPQIANIVLNQGKPFDGAASILGIPYLTSYEPIIGPEGKPIGVLFAGKTLAEAHSARNKIGMAVGIATLVVVILGFAATLFMARGITKPVKELQELMRRMSQGDLTVRGRVHTRDEIGEMVGEFNDMAKEQNQILSTVRASSDELSATAEQMAASAQQITSTIGEVASNMSHLAANTVHAKDSVIQTSKVLVQLSSLIQIAKERAQTAQLNSSHALEAATMGAGTVRETIERMENISTKTAITEKCISELDAYSKQIGLITDTITNIAGQTNLLALNAAIEAARAGEAGRGFAVVAEEVRKLAEQSNQGAEEVAGLVRKVADSTLAAVAATQESRVEVEQGVSLAKHAGAALSKIVDSVNETVASAEKILDITQSEVATSEQIVALIEDIAEINENNAANAEEVSAAAEEMAATMHTVATGASETAGKGVELKTTVERFKLA